MFWTALVCMCVNYTVICDMGDWLQPESECHRVGVLSTHFTLSGEWSLWCQT